MKYVNYYNNYSTIRKFPTIQSLIISNNLTKGDGQIRTVVERGGTVPVVTGRSLYFLHQGSYG